MNVQDRIKQQYLAGTNATANTVFNTLTSLLGGKLIPLEVPIKKCHFIIKLNDPSFQGIDVPADSTLLLKSFSIPQVGLKYSMSEDSLFFPEPSVTANAMELEAYVFKSKWNKGFGDLQKIYRNQFKSGLLSMQPKPQFDLGILIDDVAGEVSNSIFGNIEMTRLMTLPNNIKAATSGNFTQALGTAAMEVTDLLMDADIKDEQLVYLPLMSFENCVLDKPVISGDPSSNEFATQKAVVSYYDVSFY